MTGLEPRWTADGRSFWSGTSWVAAGPLVIPIRRRVSVKYSKEIEPPEFRARFGSVFLVIGFALTLPAMFAGTIFSMAIATGQSPVWPTIGEGLAIFAVVLGFFGIWPVIGLLVSIGPADGARWVLLCLICSGVVPAIVIGGLEGISRAPISDFAASEVWLSWMWAVPALGLLFVRGTRIGRALPPAAAFVRMFGTTWRKRLPGLQTEWGVVGFGTVSVPEGEFSGLPELYQNDLDLVAGERVRVTYDLTAGTIEAIQVEDAQDDAYTKED